ncbi:MAG: hypothetical protein K9N23_17695 [Akkermansiaceae bacterium]|nr:hypothetical protein [Akkermansiaceae bacterium]MCF7733527.1 hypothetical protein [Akkermansiaceae bacterium]
MNRFSCMWHRILSALIGCSLGGWALPAEGEIIANMTNLTVPSGSLTSPHYVIDSDAENAAAGYDRDVIHGGASVTFTNSLKIADSGTYRLAAQLIDPAGNPVTLATGGTSVYSSMWTVSFTALQGQQTHSFAVDIDPEGDLGAGLSYTISYTVQRGMYTEFLGRWRWVWSLIDGDGPDVTAAFTVVHFPDLPENTANRNARGWLRGTPTWTKTFAAASGTGTAKSFTVTVPYALARYDLGGSTVAIPVRFIATLTDDLGNAIPLANGGATTATFTRSAYSAGTPIYPYRVTGTWSVSFAPVGQLDPANRTYRVAVRFEHLETTPSTYRDDGTTPETGLQRLLHFNGTLRFGTLATQFTAISNSPVAGTLGVNYVSTTLNVPAGTIPGFPQYSFGAGPDMPVRLENDGDAVLTSGSREVLVEGGGVVEATFGGVRVTYPGTTIGTSAAVAGSTVVHLPQGLGYTDARGSSGGRYQAEITLGGRPLGNTFRHSGNPSMALSTDAWVFDEARPLEYAVEGFKFLQSGEMVFDAKDAEWVHQAAFETLDQNQATGFHAQPRMQYRLTNDGYLRFAGMPSPGEISFVAHADGSARTKVAKLDVKGGTFRTHFPADTELAWGGGNFSIVDGIIAEGGRLVGAAPLEVKYDGSCDDGDCGPVPGSAVDAVSLKPSGDELRFTADGGLYAASEMNPKELRWGIRDDGNVAHRTDRFAEADFLAPGNQLYQAENPLAKSGPLKGVAEYLAPGSVLLAGYDRTDHNHPVYSGSARYRDGVGAYGGATMVVAGGPAQGASRLADMTDEYRYLLQRDVSKYYVRPSGVSGRHVAEEGSFQDQAVLYDYKFDITRFQLTYLSNKNHQSWVNGSVAVPKPSGFSQRFLGLTLTCTGALDEATIDPDDSGSKPLHYWNGAFVPLAMRFAPMVGASCYDPRTLTLGLVSGAANIDTPLAGSLAFKPSGNIGTIADQIAGVDSRLGLPATVPMDGPGDEVYQLTPVSKLYFNNPEATGAPTSGYVSFAASCGVPFFEDLKLHVMTSAQAGVPADIFMAAGWPEGGFTHFTNANFDETHRGFPPSGVTVENYRKPSAENAFVPVASQWLFGIVSLSYPLKWSPTGRYFTSWEAETNELLVVNVEHQVDYLSADNAELSFGAQYDGLPEINLVSAAVDAVDAQIGAAKALTEAASQFVTDTLNQGVDEIGNLASDTLEGVLDRALDAVETEVITPLYTGVANSYSAAAAANKTYGDWVNPATGTLKTEFDRYLDGSIGVAANSVKGRLNQLHNAASDASNVLVRIQDALDQGILAIDSVTSRIEVINGGVQFNLNPPTVPSGPTAQLVNGLLAKVNNPSTGQLERQIVQNLVGQLIRELAPTALADLLTSLAGELTAELNAQLNELLSEFDPTLDRITEALLETRAYLVQVREKLASGQAIFTSFQQIIAQASAEIDGIVNELRAVAYGFIDQMATAATYTPTRVLGTAGNLMGEFSQEEFVALIRSGLRDRLLAADFIQQLQYTLRQYISEIDMAMRSAIDSAFAEVSRMCKELIKEALGPIDDAINPLLGDVNAFMGAGSIDGYARIQGDTLRCLRLDAKVQFKIPEEMELHAYFEMNCYDSSSDVGSAGCLAAGTQAVEVKVGALDVPLDWVSPDLRADVEVWFSMQTGPVRPRGVGGSIKMTGGELNFQSLKITEFQASVAVGLDECYLAATARVVISSYEAAGGIFFGRTCSIEPLEMVDPEVAALLGSPPFTGAYVYGEVWIPISEVVLGIPASCLFRISAGVGAGAFYFAEGPTFGGKMMMGVSGEALCVVSIRGAVTMIGVMTNGSLRFAGKGSLKGKAGWCPFCIKFSKSAKITYQDGDWSVDL